jgi:DNA-binding response OmpR family regulator
MGNEYLVVWQGDDDTGSLVDNEFEVFGQRLAANGDEGLQIFREDSIDVVIVDRAMPRMSGDQVAARIKAVDQAVPVIMLTGFGDLMKDRQECPHGVDLIARKPITQTELSRAMAGVLSGLVPTGPD